MPLFSPPTHGCHGSNTPMMPPTTTPRDKISVTGRWRLSGVLKHLWAHGLVCAWAQCNDTMFSVGSPYASLGCQRVSDLEQPPGGNGAGDAAGKGICIVRTPKGVHVQPS